MLPSATALFLIVSLATSNGFLPMLSTASADLASGRLLHASFEVRTEKKIPNFDCPLTVTRRDAKYSDTNALFSGRRLHLKWT